MKLKFSIVITYIIFSMLVSQTKDYSFFNNLNKQYNIEKTINFQNKILNVNFAKDTDEYIVTTEGNGNNILGFYNADNSLIWQKKFEFSIGTKISNNGNTIMLITSIGEYLFLDRSGELLFKEKINHSTFSLSPNGEFIIELNPADGPRQFCYYTRNGEKIIPDLPEKFKAPLFYSYFTPDNKILALFTGQGSPRNEVGSFLIKYDISSKIIEWQYKINDTETLVPYFESGKSTFINNNVVILYIYDIINQHNEYISLSYDDGNLIWRKEYENSLILQSTGDYIIKDEKSLVINSSGGFVYELNIKNGKIKTIFDYPEKIGRFSKVLLIGNEYLLSPNYLMNYHYLVNIETSGKAVYQKIKGKLIQKGKNEFYNIDNKTLNIINTSGILK